MSTPALFESFNTQLETRLDEMMNSGYPIMRLDVDNDEFYNHYLDSFPEGTNNIFRERREYDCNCCKNYIRKIGHIVALAPTGYMTIWDNVNTGTYYDVVAKAMAAYLQDKSVVTRFYTSEKTAGFVPNKDNTSDIIWTHFYREIPGKLVKSEDRIGPLLNGQNGSFDSLKRSMETFTIDAMETVLELITQNSIYRGSEFKNIVQQALECKKQYDATEGDYNKLIFLWNTVESLDMACRFRSTVIGTLIEDLSLEVELNKAVASFESKVAPTNYKRSSSVVTPRMVKDAQEKITQLGYLDSLHRRHATMDDIPASALLHVSQAEKALNVFDDITSEAKAKFKPKDFDKVEKVTLEKFIQEILPTVNSLELFMENRFQKNIVSIIAPIDSSAPNMFKWAHPISWTYKGNITDSIAENVKKYGGDTEGFFRVSLAWFNSDDLDLAIRDPLGRHAYFSDKKGIPYGLLDLDMNGLDKHSDTDPVENFIVKNESSMPDGKYEIYVDAYSKRARKDEGFTLQVKIGDDLYDFNYDKTYTGHKEKALTIVKTGSEYTIKVEMGNLIPMSGQSHNVSGLETNSFVKVNSVFTSPNFWDGQEIGNKHYIFAIDECKIDEPLNGFFNEYLNAALTENRKVFEVLGAKTAVAPSDNQLSGLGFSITQSESFFVRVSGKTTRVLEINV